MVSAGDRGRVLGWGVGLGNSNRGIGVRAGRRGTDARAGDAVGAVMRGNGAGLFWEEGSFAGGGAEARTFVGGRLFLVFRVMFAVFVGALPEVR